MRSSLRYGYSTTQGLSLARFDEMIQEIRDKSGWALKDQQGDDLFPASGSSMPLRSCECASGPLCVIFDYLKIETWKSAASRARPAKSRHGVIVASSRGISTAAVRGYGKSLTGHGNRRW
jgi:hypothetical protein